MKITYRQAADSSKALVELTKIGLPLKASLDVARLSNRIDVELRVFGIARQSIVTRHGINPYAAEEEGFLNFNMSGIGDGKVDTEEKKKQKFIDFFLEFNELLDTEIPDLDIVRIKIPEKALLELSKAPSEDIPPKSLKAIADFVEVE